MENARTINRARWYISLGQLEILPPERIAKETPKCYFGITGTRYLKAEEGEAGIKDRTNYPYVDIWSTKDLPRAAAVQKILEFLQKYWGLHEADPGFANNSTRSGEPGARKVILTVKETRILSRETEITEGEYMSLQGQAGDETPVLDSLYAEIRYAPDETERDYEVYDYSTDKVIVEMDD